MPATECNFDGIVGPTHNYAGLAHGNLASQQNRHLLSHPRHAALQGLAKMKFLADLGIPQGILLPHPRPHFAALRRLGFAGTDAAIVEQAARSAPHLLAACYSASAMWAANAATISPSADTADARLHITPANLASHLHRSLEADTTAAAFREIFPGPNFAHHDPLPATLETSDEGAANHTRLCAHFGGPGIELFVHGTPRNGRQTRAASEAIARLHQLSPDRVLFLEQNPAAIAAGVFHNDVIAVGHRNILLHHELAFADGPPALEKIRLAFQQATGTALHIITIPDTLLPLADAVRSYFFNSQLITLPAGTLAFIAPIECQEIPTAASAIAHLQDQLPAIAIHYIDLRESMRNGGGPACLRIRIELTPAQQASINPKFLLTEARHKTLKQTIEHHYRETLSPADLADPQLIQESATALEALQNQCQKSTP